MITQPYANRLNRVADKLSATSVALTGFLTVGCGLLGPFAHGAKAHNSIHEAALRGDTAKLAEIVRANPNSVRLRDSNGNTPLHLASFHYRVEAVDFLLRWGADINETNTVGMTPLMLAAKAGNLAVIKALLRHGANTKIKDAHGWTALKWAKKTHHYQSAMEIAIASAFR